MTAPTTVRHRNSAHRTTHCTADAAGTLTFDLVGAAGTSTDAGGELVLRRRGGLTAADEVRLPLTGVTGVSGALLRAVLPGGTELAEGRWDVLHAAAPDAEGPRGERETAVRPGVRDLRRLVDRVPATGRVTVRVPYPTVDGRLAIRCWVRAPHAEAGEISFARAAVTVRGVLYGAEAGEGAVAEARLCGDDDGVDGGPDGRTGRRVRRVPVTAEPDGTFAFTLPYQELAEPPVRRRQLWELWLRPARGSDAVRVSRLLDDIWDRKNTHVYPVRETERWSAAPCYSGDNDLCVRLDPPAG